MKIGIHYRKGSFSDRWIKYCNEKDIPYKLVNCYDNDIMAQLADCDALMWHHSHSDYRDVLFSKQLLFSLEQSGKVVFPNINTGWHFDDKVGQKYLLESINAPLIDSFVFYDKMSALEWAKRVSYPKVFKLRGGASALNVKLVKNYVECVKLINRSFKKGFSQYNSLQGFKNNFDLFRKNKDIKYLIEGIGGFFIQPRYSKMQSKEKGYIYFQEFIPDNKYDVRLIVIGDRAYGMKRLVRKGDFRASGSNEFLYEDIDSATLETAFSVSNRLGLQCAAFDFVYQNNSPLIVEISFGYGTKGSDKCPGFWNSDLEWFPGKFNAQEWVVDEVVKKITSK